jgi:hypothetical protein
MYTPKYVDTRFDGGGALPSIVAVQLRAGGTSDMMALTPVNLRSVAVIGSRCDDIATGAGATLIEIARDKPDLVVHALVLTGGGTEREVEEKNAFAALCPTADVRLTVADLPSGELSSHRGRVQKLLADFRQDSEPDMVFGPQSGDHDHDRQLLNELIPSAFRDQPILGYEILAWESELPSTSLYLPISTDAAHEKARLLTRCYSPRPGKGWCDDEAVLGLMRVRGVQCRARYAEAFTVENSVLQIGPDHSVN